MVVRLTATCDPAGAAEQASRHPGVRHYQRTERPAGGGSTWTRFREIPASLLGVHRRLT